MAKSHDSQIDPSFLSILLPDGRTLAYAEYGDPLGKCVIHCNGSGGSRLEHPTDEAMLRELKIRFIAVDRPGHGYSSPQPDRRILDFPDDVVALADHLKIGKFYIEGWSAGGAYALACAYKHPERVIAGAILSGIAPYERPSPYEGLAGVIKMWMFFARCVPPLVFPFRRMMHSAIMSKSPEEIGSMLASGDSMDDKAVAQSPELQLMMGENVREGYRQGWKGPAQDDIIICQEWGFKLEDIRSRIDIWQGAVDQNVPKIQGEYQFERLPNSHLTTLEATAHLFPLVRWKEILSQLVRP